MSEETKNIDPIVNSSFKIRQSTKDEIYKIKDEQGSKMESMAVLFDTMVDKFYTPSDKKLSEKINRLESELDKLQDELSERESTIISQQNTIADHESTIAALNGQLESVSGENERLAGDVANVEEMTRKNLLISDPELVEELKLIQKAVLLSSKKEKTINEIVTTLVFASRRNGTYVIGKELREKLKSM